MVRWMYGVSLKNRISSKELSKRMGAADVVRQGHLRWFGHFEHIGKNERCLHVEMLL